MRKRLFVFLIVILIMFPVLVKGEVYYSGDSNGSNGISVGDQRSGWYSGIGTYAGVRLTVIAKNGDRLKLNVGGKDYTSRTLDYYDGYNNGNNQGTSITGSSPIYFNCNQVWQGGVKVNTLCYKKDYSGINSNNLGDYFTNYLSHRNWNTINGANKANEYGTVERSWNAVFGNGYNGGWTLPSTYATDYNGKNSLYSIFRQFRMENSSNANYGYFERIFEDLMGVSINDIQAKSQSACDSNKKALQEAFIVVEPVSKFKAKWIGNNLKNQDFVGSATEIGMIFAQRTDYSGCSFCRRDVYNLFHAIYRSNTPLDGEADKKFDVDNFYFDRVDQIKTTDDTNSLAIFGDVLGNILLNNKWAYGIGALRFSSATNVTEKINCYNYSIDAACTDCESKNSDNKAYVIQDTTNWDAIKNSTNYNSADEGINKCVKGHFYREPGVYCREEYHVFLPNQNNKIVVQTGKYFTLNRDRENADSTIVIPNDVPDFEPIRVEKIRECTGDSTKLERFEANSKDDFIGKSGCDGAGTVEVSYSEGIDGDYTLKNQELKHNNKNYSQNINGDRLTQKLVNYYTLNTDTFRYIRKKDGKSVSKKEDGESYVDLGIGNLPISFRNNKANVKVGFGYKLPKCDKFSEMSVAFDDGTCKLSNGDSEANVYKNYKKGVKIPNENIEESACVKLYGAEYLNEPSKGIENYNYALEQHQKLVACINKRQTKKSGNCEKNLSTSKIVDKTNARNNNDDKDKTEKDSYSYVCFEPVVGKPNICEEREENGIMVYYDNSGESVTKSEYETKCCTKNNAASLGRSWNDKDNVCCPYGQTYDSGKGTCVSKNNECTQDNAASLGRSWNSAVGECCPKGEKYNDKTKKCEVPCDGLKCDTDSNGNPACCTDSSGNASCGYYKNGNLICPGKPSFDDIIYRPIDLSQPFIAQNGSERKVGENWCAVVGGVLKCDDNEENTVVKTIIKDSNVSEENAMYKVELNPETIRKIRAYNKEAKTYNDWDLECASDGKACTSKFLRETINDKVEGRCAGVEGKDAFYNCG